MDWRLQVLGKHVLQRLPGGHHLHRWIQEQVGVLGDMDQAEKLHGRVIPEFSTLAAESEFQFEDAVICEAGTGWHTLTPIVFYLLGAEEIHTHDVTRWLTTEYVTESVDAVGDNLDSIADAFDVDEQRLRERFDAISVEGSVDEKLASFNTTYHVYAEPDVTDPSRPYTLFYSFSVLHRVPLPELHSLLDQVANRAAPGAYSYHVVEHVDVLAINDPSRNPFQYLSYPDWVMDLLQTRYSSQNRLRHSQFLSLFAEYGFTPVYKEQKIGNFDHFGAMDGGVDSLDAVDLDEQFRGLDREDLATTRSRYLHTIDAT